MLLHVVMKCKGCDLPEVELPQMCLMLIKVYAVTKNH